MRFQQRIISVGITFTRFPDKRVSRKFHALAHRIIINTALNVSPTATIASIMRRFDLASSRPLWRRSARRAPRPFIYLETVINSSSKLRQKARLLFCVFSFRQFPSISSRKSSPRMRIKIPKRKQFFGIAARCSFCELVEWIMFRWRISSLVWI